MPSQTDLYNDALGQIGASRVTSPSDGSVNANWCNTFYENLRKARLRTHTWNFAESRMQLAQDATPPAFEFAFSYTLPPDLVRIKEFNGAEPKTVTSDPMCFLIPSGYYKIEGRHLLTNDGLAFIVYVRDITNPDEWDPLFYQVLATELAAKLAAAISKDSRKSQALIQTALGLLLPLALAVDGQEGTVVPYRVDDLTWGR